MPEPFFTQHAWDYATDPEYRRRWDKRQQFIWGVIVPLVGLVYILLIVAGVALAPKAHADDGTGQYLSSLHRDGINIPDDVAINTGHETCNAEGLPRIGIGIPAPYSLAHIHIYQELQAVGLNHPQMLQLERDAATVWCPQALGQ